MPCKYQTVLEMFEKNQSSCLCCSFGKIESFYCLFIHLTVLQVMKVSTDAAGKTLLDTDRTNRICLIPKNKCVVWHCTVRTRRGQIWSRDDNAAVIWMTSSGSEAVRIENGKTIQATFGEKFTFNLC